MSITKSHADVRVGSVYVSLEANEVIVLADLLRYMAGYSSRNEAPGHARFAREFADGIEQILKGEAVVA